MSLGRGAAPKRVAYSVRPRAPVRAGPRARLSTSRSRSGVYVVFVDALGSTLKPSSRRCVSMTAAKRAPRPLKQTVHLWFDRGRCSTLRACLRTDPPRQQARATASRPSPTTSSLRSSCMIEAASGADGDAHADPTRQPWRPQQLARSYLQPRDIRSLPGERSMRRRPCVACANPRDVPGTTWIRSRLALQVATPVAAVPTAEGRRRTGGWLTWFGVCAASSSS
jgi:hypothetical protein